MPRAVVTGGAGFVGSHICRELLTRGFEVIAVDNLLTGSEQNVADLSENDRFTFVKQDISEDLAVDGDVSHVLHFASAASPPEYLKYPIETMMVGSAGTKNALDLAKSKGSIFLLASTSEIYGDPLEHPQKESYWGNVNSVGPRSVYDEAKRFAEALSMAYHRKYVVDVKMARIFNTYGPYLKPGDGRVVSNFLVQAMRGEPLTIYGTGEQTRSFCYVDDEVRGLLALLDSSWNGAMNIGNPVEFSVQELADTVLKITGSNSEIIFKPLPVDDPTRRQPDISLARQELGWEPQVTLEDGLKKTFAWFQEELIRKPGLAR